MPAMRATMRAMRPPPLIAPTGRTSAPPATVYHAPRVSPPSRAVPIEQVAAELVLNDPLNVVAGSVEQLSSEFSSWQRSHERLTASLAEGRNPFLQGIASCHGAMTAVVNDIVAEQVAEVLAETDKERQLASGMMRRILLGGATIAAATDEKAPIKEELPSAFHDMIQLREQRPESYNQHHLRVSSKWKGAPPRRHSERAPSNFGARLPALGRVFPSWATCSNLGRPELFQLSKPPAAVLPVPRPSPHPCRPLLGASKPALRSPPPVPLLYLPWPVIWPAPLFAPELADDGVVESESDDDEAAEEDQESAALTIDTSKEQLVHPMLRSAFVQKEQEHWHQTTIVERCAARAAPRDICPFLASGPALLWSHPARLLAAHARVPYLGRQSLSASPVTAPQGPVSPSLSASPVTAP